MCVLSLAWHAHPRWALVLAGNRDEFHARPAAALDRWRDPPGVIAGRDLESGGTWLGVAEAGRLAVVTNVRSEVPRDPAAPSRGALVVAALAGEEPAAIGSYAPFNLIAVAGGEARYVTNRPGDHRRTLAGGLYGLSNGGLDDPWPKSVALNAALAGWLAGPATAPELLLDALRMEGEGAASIFIRDPRYGTRCSTVVAIDRDGAGLIVERRYDAMAVQTGETAIRFRWPVVA